MLNTSEIMRAAHAAAKKVAANPTRSGRTYAQLFAMHLRFKWSDARALVAAEAYKQKSEADKLRDRIVSLECKDRWTRDDYARHDALTAELRVAA